MERVCQFLKEAGTYFLATVEGDQPRVRPFGTAHIFEGRLYIRPASQSCLKAARSQPKVESARSRTAYGCASRESSPRTTA